LSNCSSLIAPKGQEQEARTGKEVASESGRLNAQIVTGFSGGMVRVNPEINERIADMATRYF
jgi:hypothetical protein